MVNPTTSFTVNEPLNASASTAIPEIKTGLSTDNPCALSSPVKKSFVVTVITFFGVTIPSPPKIDEIPIGFA